MPRAAGRSESAARVGGVTAARVAPAGGCVGGRRAEHRSLLELARALGHGLAVGDERLLHRHDGDLDHVVGRLLRRDHLDEHARVEQRP